ncbi:MAG: PEPxxWA-CTERM sorting domain-containing protein [Sphingomonadaceae bacterium]
MRFNALGLAVICLGASASPAMAVVTFNVKCNKQVVGSVKLEVKPSQSGAATGIVGNFSIRTPWASIDAVAHACGEARFNWHQRIVKDTLPPKDKDGNPPAPPYDDPPPGGYSDQWADDLPWYWDHYGPPEDNERPWDDTYLLSNQTTLTQLLFKDFPGGLPGTLVVFHLRLVSLNEDNSFHSYHGPNISWMFRRSGLPGVGEVAFVPEPGTWAMLVTGFGLIGWAVRRKRPRAFNPDARLQQDIR